MTGRTFQIKGIRFRLGDTITLCWVNCGNLTVTGKITAYAPERGRCCLQVERHCNGWYNPRHKYVLVSKG